jgi:dihydroorotate dehydrogenase electron transfer subunit
MTLELGEAFPLAMPGQFVHVQVGGAAAFLRRPFSILGQRPLASGGSRLEIMYAVVGVATREMARLGPGARLEIMGPLGNAFALDDYRTWVLVAGGRGAVPLFRILEAVELGQLLAPSSAAGTAPVGDSSVQFLFGARSRDHLWGLDRLRGISHALATDDGSVGRRGSVIDLLGEVLSLEPPAPVVIACGPEPMLEAAARVAAGFGVPAQVSLESRMGCACGLCRGCVVPRRVDAASMWPRDGNQRYGTVCREGPVFLGSEIDWAAMPEI